VTFTVVTIDFTEAIHLTEWVQLSPVQRTLYRDRMLENAGNSILVGMGNFSHLKLQKLLKVLRAVGFMDRLAEFGFGLCGEVSGVYNIALEKDISLSWQCPIATPFPSLQTLKILGTEIQSAEPVCL
jgi:hypothetical protein